MSFVGQNPKFKTTSLEDIGLNSTPNPPAGYHKLVNRGGAVKVRDSSGLESSLGGGSGELNLIENPSDSGSWSETGTVFATPSTTTTAGDLPLGGLTDTAIQFVASGNGAEASHYNSYSFTTPASLSGKMKVEWYQRPGSGFAESEWTVSVYQGSTRQSLSTDSPSSVTYLVNANNKRTVYVDLLASTAYTLRFARVAGAGSATLNISNVIVGPGIQPQGAVVGEWQSYTPISTQGWGTVTSPVFSYKRSGSSIVIKAKFVTGTVDGNEARISLPSGLTSGTTNNLTMVAAYARDTSVTATANQVYIENGVSYLTFGRADGTVAGYTKRAGNILANSGETIGFTTAEIPIAEWAGSGTVNLSQNDVEYGANSQSLTTAGATASASNTVYGQSGTLIQSINSSTTTGNSTTIFPVTLQRPLQQGDVPKTEIYVGNGWIDSTALFPFVDQGTARYGVKTFVDSTTQVSVAFGNAGAQATGSFGASGTAWSVFNGVGYKWRVTITRAGAAVGFGIVQPGVSSGLVSASGLPGNTTGAAIASGYVGEHLLGTFSGVTITGSPTTLATIPSVTNGTYLCTIEADCTFGASARIVSILTSGTATAIISKYAFGGDWVRCVDTTTAALYVTYVVRITSPGSFIFSASSTSASSTGARGSMSLIRIA